MKKVFKYFGVLLSVALMGAFTACNIQEESGSADLGLDIKVFFPTKVVAGQPMTINGSGFSDVKEIVFPGNVPVSNFELVSGEMIRVTAPVGIAADGGNLIVRSADGQAESRVPLTLGNTVISGFSKMDGEEISGGEQFTIYGKDLEFISGVEIPDSEGNPYMLKDDLFYRKGTSTVIITIPKNVFECTFAGRIFTCDGKVFDMPELAYKPGSSGGHMEIVKVPVWTNDDPAGNGVVSWSGKYRFGLEGHDDNNECITTFDQETWDKLKTNTFYVLYRPENATSYQVRVTNGWWDVQWLGKDNDIAPWANTELITDNEDGTFTIEVTLGDDPLVETLDQKHLLLTGTGYTPLEIFFLDEVWVDDGGGDTPKEVVFWTNDDPAGNGAVSWNGKYRFGLEGHDDNNECITTFDQGTWDKIKTGTFYILYAPGDATSYQVRVTNGWWDVQWLGKDNDVAPWANTELITDNEDGPFTIVVTLGDDPLVETLDQKHLLITGNGFTPLKLYFLE